ncbi:MAG: glycoside hydrolase family 16 protein [Chthoniobacterales bacterium]
MTAKANEKKSEPFSLKSAEPAIPPSGKLAEKPTFETNFSKDWKEKSGEWRVATWMQNDTQMSPDRCRINKDGMMVQTVLPELPGRGGSMQTDREFGFGRWVARVRPSAVPGALNSIFTKDWDDLTTHERNDDGKHAEVDIEFLTYTFGKNSGKVHLAIHFKDAMNYWEDDVPLDFDPSENFHEWGFDILPDRVIWHVDGKKICEWLYTKDRKIDPDYEFFFNSWTQKKWIKGPPEKEAHYLIDYVKFYPYISE